MLAATIVLWPSRGGVAAARALQRWEQCCLDPDCFAPPNARGQPCPGCHRYDQSALNLALLDAGLAASAQRASGHREQPWRWHCAGEMAHLAPPLLELEVRVLEVDGVERLPAKLADDELVVRAIHDHQVVADGTNGMLVARKLSTLRARSSILQLQ